MPYRRRERHEGERLCHDGTEAAVTRPRPRAAWGCQELEEGGGSCPRASRGSRALGTNFRLRPGLRAGTFLLLSATQLVVLGLAAQGHTLTAEHLLLQHVTHRLREGWDRVIFFAYHLAPREVPDIAATRYSWTKGREAGTEGAPASEASVRGTLTDGRQRALTAPCPGSTPLQLLRGSCSLNVSNPPALTGP